MNSERVSPVREGHGGLMPRWLLPLTQVLYETLPAAQAQPLRLRLHEQLRRLEGQVPLRLVHLWHAEVVLPLLSDTLPAHQPVLCKLQALHQRAALGLPGRIGEWRALLKPALVLLYRIAYAYDAAHAQAHESALAFGLAPANTAMIAEHFGHAEAFAQYYAQLSTEANVTAFAQANAAANCEIAARAYARQDAEAYTAIAGPSARVCAWASAQSVVERGAVFNRLAEGLNACLAKLPADPTELAGG